jgi:hypothetical protein
MKQASVSSTDQGGGKRRAISQARQSVDRSHAHHPSGGCSTGFGAGNTRALLRYILVDAIEESSARR